MLSQSASSDGRLGMMMAHIIYPTTPSPKLQSAIITQMIRTRVGSMFRYSPNPAHTPQIILFCDLYNLFVISISFLFRTSSQYYGDVAHSAVNRKMIHLLAVAVECSDAALGRAVEPY